MQYLHGYAGRQRPTMPVRKACRKLLRQSWLQERSMLRRMIPWLALYPPGWSRALLRTWYYLRSCRKLMRITAWLLEPRLLKVPGL